MDFPPHCGGDVLEIRNMKWAFLGRFFMCRVGFDQNDGLNDRLLRFFVIEEDW